MSASTVPLARLPEDTIEDALAFIGGNLREADLAEVRATLEGDPTEIIKASAAASSKAWLLLDRTGLPMGVMGAASSGLPDVGLPWMVGTDAMLLEGLAVGRQTRDHVSEMHEDYRVLTNFVDARNDVSIDWLLWAGFHLIDADPRHGPEERLFLQFSKSR